MIVAGAIRKDTGKDNSVPVGGRQVPGQAIARLEKTGMLHAADLPVPGRSLTTDKAFADEKETIALMHAGRGRGVAIMRGRAVDKALHNGPLTAGQKDAVKLILSDKDRTVSVQG